MGFYPPGSYQDSKREFEYSSMLPGTPEEGSDLAKYLGRDISKNPPTFCELMMYRLDKHLDWAESLISHAAEEIMTVEQLSRWEGVRAWLECRPTTHTADQPKAGG